MMMFELDEKAMNESKWANSYNIFETQWVYTLFSVECQYANPKLIIRVNTALSAHPLINTLYSHSPTKHIQRKYTNNKNGINAPVAVILPLPAIDMLWCASCHCNNFLLMSFCKHKNPS